jgi:hypothetical protein
MPSNFNIDDEQQVLRNRNWEQQVGYWSWRRLCENWAEDVVGGGNWTGYQPAVCRFSALSFSVRDLVELKIWLFTFVNTISHNLLPIAFPFLFCAALERLALHDEEEYLSRSADSQTSCERDDHPNIKGWGTRQVKYPLLWFICSWRSERDVAERHNQKIVTCTYNHLRWNPNPLKWITHILKQQWCRIKRSCSIFDQSERSPSRRATRWDWRNGTSPWRGHLIMEDSIVQEVRNNKVNPFGNQQNSTAMDVRSFLKLATLWWGMVCVAKIVEACISLPTKIDTATH